MLRCKKENFFYGECYDDGSSDSIENVKKFSYTIYTMI